MNTKIVSVIALCLMIFAMLLYVASDDESIEPFDGEVAVEQPVPAAE
jgi:hypothetical protein